MTIARVAYLYVCAHCGMHGRIVLPGGSTSKEFTTQRQGFEEVDRLLANVEMAADEAAFLKESIKTSSLPEKEALIFDLLEKVLDIRARIESEVYEHPMETEEEPPKPRTYH